MLVKLLFLAFKIKGKESKDCIAEFYNFRPVFKPMKKTKNSLIAFFLIFYSNMALIILFIFPSIFYKLINNNRCQRASMANRLLHFSRTGDNIFPSGLADKPRYF